ncbi:MAG: EAL domain-containing protein [Sulfurovum sp.]|nr:EAL domain-containing protein [Sulfurovum sp.]
MELTERYIMEYSTEKLTILDDLRSLGCKIAIDDFGTGYSSMSYLKSLAIDTIKIDKSFIVDIPKNKHDVEVSKAIILLSHSLGYKVIAEGVETAEQEALLASYDCDMGQGYYFAKPLLSEDIVSFYHQNEKERAKE